jgi:hypothetical protein
MTQPLPNLKHLEFGGAAAIPDPDAMKIVASILAQPAVDQWLHDKDLHHRFVEQYRRWIISTESNKIRGLQLYPVSASSQGTSESFDKFYLKNHTRRFRCFKGEYMYHAASWKTCFPNWSWIDDGAIQAGDAVVMSYPFSDTGDKHPAMDHVLDQCDRLGVPVLIDCAFFGACHGLEFDFDRESITDITFSLSKTLPVPHARIGIRFTKKDDDDGLMIHHKTAYVNRLALGLGIDIMMQIGPDHCCGKFVQKQNLICQDLGVEPSATVFLGIDKQGRWPQYNRGTDTNRLCIANRLASHD